MRQSALLTGSVFTLSLWAPAQTASFTIYPDATAATTRSGIPTHLAGDLLTEVNASLFRGVGRPQPGVLSIEGLVVGFHVVIQSNFGPEPYNFVIYGDDPQSPGQPNAFHKFRTPTLLTPGTGAWLINMSLATPVPVIPLEKTWYYGVGLFSAAPYAEGGSIHMAPYQHLGAPFPDTGGNPRAGAPSLTWSIQFTGALPIISQPTPKQVLAMGVLTDSPVLNNGADIAPAFQRGPNPSFGVAGIYPANGARGDGLAFRVRDPQTVGNPVLVTASSSFSSPAGASFLEGFFLLNLNVLIPIASGTMPGRGELVLQPPFLAQGQLPPSLNATIAFQAFTAGGRIRASNATVTSFK